MNAPTPISNLGLAADELDKLNACWGDCNYLAAGMIFRRDVQSSAGITLMRRRGFGGGG